MLTQSLLFFLYKLKTFNNQLEINQSLIFYKLLINSTYFFFFYFLLNLKNTKEKKMRIFFSWKTNRDMNNEEGIFNQIARRIQLLRTAE